MPQAIRDKRTPTGFQNPRKRRDLATTIDVRGCPVWTRKKIRLEITRADELCRTQP